MSSGKSPISRVLVTPRLTRDYIVSLVKKTQFYHFPGSRVTVCCVTTSNGHEFVGDAICDEKRRFNFEKGKEISFEKVLLSITASERYLLRQRLHEHRTQS